MFPLTFLAWLFSPAVDLTAAPRFADREFGSEVLAAAWPFSEPVLSLGRGSADAEVRMRARRATPAGYLAVRQLLATDAGKRAFRLLVHPFEADGLPAADPDLVAKYLPNPDVRAALSTLAYRLGLVEAHETLSAEADTFDPFADGYPTYSLDVLRRRLRGLAGVYDSDELRKRWQAVKGDWAAWK